MTNVDLFDQAPTVEEHTRLRASAGLSSYSSTVTGPGLSGSWFAVVARDASGTAVGMGRLIGDGAMFAHVVDMAVDPHHQRQGIGSRILERLLAHADHAAPHAYISLVADPPGQQLYRSFGFENVDPAIGMKRRRPKRT